MKSWIGKSALVLGLITAADGARAESSHPLDPPRDVVTLRVSMLLVDVLRILDAEQAVEADVFVRVEWDDPRLAQPGTHARWLAPGELWTPRLQLLAPRDTSTLMPMLIVVDADGHLTYTQRYVGTFGAPTNLADFPFDSHDFALQFLLLGEGTTDLSLEMGPIVGQSKKMSAPDWEIGQGELDLSPIVVNERMPPITGFSYSFHARRYTSHYVKTIVLPLVVIVMMSWTVFWAPPSYIAVQFGFAATSILTVIAYRFALASQVPPVPYSTRLDAFVNGAFLLAFLALVEVILTSQLIHRERTAAAIKVDMTCRWLFPLLLGGTWLYAFVLK